MLHVHVPSPDVPTKTNWTFGSMSISWPILKMYFLQYIILPKVYMRSLKNRLNIKHPRRNRWFYHEKGPFFSNIRHSKVYFKNYWFETMHACTWLSLVPSSGPMRMSVRTDHLNNKQTAHVKCTELRTTLMSTKHKYCISYIIYHTQLQMMFTSNDVIHILKISIAHAKNMNQ